MELLLTFIGLNIVNVILQTYKSIATIKYGKIAASLVNAVAYGLYTICLVYMSCDLNLWAKVGIVGGANLIGVFVVKLIEEKTYKAKLWKVEATISAHDFGENLEILENFKVPHSFIELSNGSTLANFYCATREQSELVKGLLNEMNAKYFVSESKQL